MKATASIDKAGRLVIPKKIREKLHLAPGVLVELETVADHLALRIADDPDCRVVEKDGLLVIEGGIHEDAVTAIKADREARMARLESGEGS